MLGKGEVMTREEFVCRAAIANYAAERGTEVSTNKFSIGAAWECAEALWDARPEWMRKPPAQPACVWPTEAYRDVMENFVRYGPCEQHPTHQPPMQPPEVKQ